MNVGNGLEQQLEIFRLDIRKTLPIVKVWQFDTLLQKKRFSTAV